jgi:hypothetical protein
VLAGIMQKPACASAPGYLSQKGVFLLASTDNSAPVTPTTLSTRREQQADMGKDAEGDSTWGIILWARLGASPTVLDVWQLPHQSSATTTPRRQHSMQTEFARSRKHRHPWATILHDRIVYVSWSVNQRSEGEPPERWRRPQAQRYQICRHIPRALLATACSWENATATAAILEGEQRQLILRDDFAAADETTNLSRYTPTIVFFATASTCSTRPQVSDPRRGAPPFLT